MNAVAVARPGLLSKFGCGTGSKTCGSARRLVLVCRLKIQEAKLLPFDSSFLKPSSALHAIVREWVSNNDGIVRTAPAFVGCSSILAVLLNRYFSGVYLVADAGSSQSRADVLTLLLAVTIVLTSLTWISIRPKAATPVNPDGIECERMDPTIPDKLKGELNWVWQSLQKITCCRSLVLVYRSTCILQIGMASKASSSSRESDEAMTVDPVKLTQGSLCQAVWKAGKQNYLANLAVYPGRFELSFLPQNCQAVLLQPLGDEGIMIIGGDTIRGFSLRDQTWITLVAEKLDFSLSKCFPENK